VGLVVLRGSPDCLSTPLGEVAHQEKMGQRFFLQDAVFHTCFIIRPSNLKTSMP
jgi:hypothetical protein